MATTDTDRPVRLLHLSDIHFRAGTAWDADPVLRDLARFVAKEVGAGLAPDLVAITGDLAFSGKRDDYALARTWLDQALWPVLSEDASQPLPPDRLLLVPGNHDVDRDAIDVAAEAIQSDILAGGDQTRIAKLLGQAPARAILLAHHAAYLDFYARWLGGRPAKKGTLPWWQRLSEIRGQRLHIAGLDSAWMACGDQDRGRLLLGRYQINQGALHRDGDAADWRLALLHHPWDYLAEFDAHEARQTVHLHRDLVLRGHLHEGEAAFVRPPDPARACLELAAGCVYDGSRHPNAFQWVELWPPGHGQPRRVRVLFRVWVKGAWQIDRNQPGCEDGEALFELDTVSGDGPDASRRLKEPDSRPSAQAEPAPPGSAINPTQQTPDPGPIRSASLVGQGPATRPDDPRIQRGAPVGTEAAADTPGRDPGDDGAFDRHWQACRDRNLKEVAAALAKSPALLQALSAKLAGIGRCPALESVAPSKAPRVRAAAGCLLDLDFDTFAAVVAALYRPLRDAADSAGRAAGDERGALDALLDIMLHLAPMLYDRALARTAYVRSRSADLVELPAALYTVAELAMAAEEGRAAAYRPRKGSDDDDARGFACLSIAVPELGMDATREDDCERIVGHLDRKNMAPNAFRKDRFLQDCDRFLERYYPSGRPTRGSSQEERLADRRRAVDAQLPDWPDDKGRPYQLYTVFRPETLEALQEMRETALELHRRYPSLRILFLTACRADPGGDHRWDLEMARLKGFCRILRFHQ